MKIYAESERLLLREILPSDEAGLYELDADPKVHRYLGNNPVKSLEEVRELIQFIRQQYINNGIGRWAIIDKATGAFMGWTGLKWITEPSTITATTTIWGTAFFANIGARAWLQKLPCYHWNMGLKS